MYGRRAVDLLDLAGQRPGVLGEDAGALLGRQQLHAEGSALADHLAVAALEDQRRPDEANVARDLLGTEE